MQPISSYWVCLSWVLITGSVHTDFGRWFFWVVLEPHCSWKCVLVVLYGIVNTPTKFTEYHLLPHLYESVGRISRFTLTPLCIMLKNGQTCFKNLLVWTLQDCKYVWPFVNIIHGKVNIYKLVLTVKFTNFLRKCFIHSQPIFLILPHFVNSELSKVSRLRKRGTVALNHTIP